MLGKLMSRFASNPKPTIEELVPQELPDSEKADVASAFGLGESESNKDALVSHPEVLGYLHERGLAKSLPFVLDAALDAPDKATELVESFLFHLGFDKPLTRGELGEVECEIPKLLVDLSNRIGMLRVIDRASVREQQRQRRNSLFELYSNWQIAAFARAICEVGSLIHGDAALARSLRKLNKWFVTIRCRARVG